jgi:sugar phosphate isomerase/epimerase
MGGGDANMSLADEAKWIESETKRIREIAEAAKQVDCKVGLYNHGGWFGIPENQVRLIEALQMPNVGIVYNLHHAHDQLDRLPTILQAVKPYALAINLNGTQTDGERIGKKILPIGDGDRDIEVLNAIRDCGYTGLIGILNHTDLDAKQRLSENLLGLAALVHKLDSNIK